MHLEPQVRRWFFECVINTPELNSELRASILRNKRAVRVEKFIQVLAKDLVHAQAVATMKTKKPISMKTLKDTTFDLTKLYILGIENEAHKRVESETARLAREAEKSKNLEFEAASRGEALGDFKDAGVIFVDDREAVPNETEKTESKQI